MHWTVIGHERQKAHIERMITAGMLAHAYVLHGPQGIGKRMFADELAAMLGAESDRMLLGPEVEDARAMKAWAYARPLFGAHKVVIIDDVERLSDAAANTVLKVLEEPPAYLHFLLITSQLGRVLPTIASRCQDVAFQPLNIEEMKKALVGISLDADEKQLLAVVAAGRPGEALRLVQEKQLPAVAKAIAGLEQALRAGIAERIGFAKTIADDDNAPHIVSWWLSWMHAQLPNHPQYAPVIHRLLDLHSAVAETKYNHRLAVEQFFLEVTA